MAPAPNGGTAANGGTTPDGGRAFPNANPPKPRFMGIPKALTVRFEKVKAERLRMSTTIEKYLDNLFTYEKLPEYKDLSKEEKKEEKEEVKTCKNALEGLNKQLKDLETEFESCEKETDEEKKYNILKTYIDAWEQNCDTIKETLRKNVRTYKTILDKAQENADKIAKEDAEKNAQQEAQQSQTKPNKPKQKKGNK